MRTYIGMKTEYKLLSANAQSEIFRRDVGMVRLTIELSAKVNNNKLLYSDAIGTTM